MITTCRATLQSPIGTVAITGSDAGIAALVFLDETQPASDNIPDWLRACAAQWADYFAGQRREFDLPLDLQGTAFEKQVWAELLKIPFGETRSYLQIAEALGDKNAVRAVGSANGKNPVSVIVPCHRVIGSDGSLTGYGGGVWRKAWLLEHEGFPIQRRLFP